MKQFKISLLFAWLFILSWNSIQAQDLYYTKDGRIDFFSSTPVEDIEAINTKVNSVLKTSTGEIEFSVLIMAFQFEKALMQEHFNEKFMESEKYNKTIFKGHIVNSEDIDYSTPGEYKVVVTGDITIHGVTKKITVDGAFQIEDGLINADSKFYLAPADFDIEIPSVVKQNIAKQIKVTLNAVYEPFTGN